MTQRRIRPEERAAEHQRRTVRDELHDIIDRLVDDWPSIDQLAALALAHSSNSEGRSSDVSDPTLSAILTHTSDEAHQWLDDFRRFRVSARLLDGKRANMALAKAEPGRKNTIDKCALCGLPNPKMHRVDGEPYCATTCYYRVWRGRQHANVQTQ